MHSKCHSAWQRHETSNIFSRVQGIHVSDCFQDMPRYLIKISHQDIPLSRLATCPTWTDHEFGFTPCEIPIQLPDLGLVIGMCLGDAEGSPAIFWMSFSDFSAPNPCPVFGFQLRGLDVRDCVLLLEVGSLGCKFLRNSKASSTNHQARYKAASVCGGEAL